jgi:2-oxo-4-hydroxy-4-carboxy--5-ureidoimidazoline (OHCU) decarboxylase
LGRGIEREQIFRDESDRKDFTNRVSNLSKEKAWTVYAWALLAKNLARGGRFALHNAIRQADAMRDYLKMIRRHPDFDTVTLSATMDDGFCLRCRHRGHGTKGGSMRNFLHG